MALTVSFFDSNILNNVFNLNLSMPLLFLQVSFLLEAEFSGCVYLAHYLLIYVACILLDTPSV